MMIPACRLADLPRGEAVRLDIHPPVSVFHTDDGELYAIDDTCTHQDASLADGWLEGCEVECPLHASKFDLRTGAVDAPPAKLPVRTHQVVVEDGMIHVRLSEAPPNLPPTCVAARLGATPVTGGTT
jgi:3-phenylpropionate/trans-cinnamate dioxygenase ferredoxin subunit